MILSTSLAMADGFLAVDELSGKLLTGFGCGCEKRDGFYVCSAKDVKYRSMVDSRFIKIERCGGKRLDLRIPWTRIIGYSY